jgi:acyl carrier protein
MHNRLHPTVAPQQPDVDEKAKDRYNRQTFRTPAPKEEKMDVFGQVKDIVVELLDVDPDQVTAGATFKEDLEADSLDLVELLMAFEDEFGSQIPDEDVKKILTVGNAVAYIEEKIKEQEA